MNNLDLFAGIGGFALGLERAGFKTAAFLRSGKVLPEGAETKLAGGSYL